MREREREREKQNTIVKQNFHQISKLDGYYKRDKKRMYLKKKEEKKVRGLRGMRKMKGWGKG